MQNVIILAMNSLITIVTLAEQLVPNFQLLKKAKRKSTTPATFHL